MRIDGLWVVKILRRSIRHGRAHVCRNQLCNEGDAGGPATYFVDPRNTGLCGRCRAIHEGRFLPATRLMPALVLDRQEGRA